MIMERHFIHEDDTQIRIWVSGNVLTKAEEIVMTKDRYEKYDIEYMINGKKIKLEIKNRHFNHNKYVSSDIELDKWIFLTGNSAQLCVLYDDGLLFYNSKEVKETKYKVVWRLAPDQYDPENNNSFKLVWKQFVQLRILDNKFYPYDEYFTSKPPREIIPSKYND